MKNRGAKSRKLARKIAAEVRQVVRNKRSTKDQLMLLKSRPGDSRKERTRLIALYNQVERSLAQ